MKKTKKILITGGLGFIGTNLLRRLLKNSNYSFIILDKITSAGRLENLPREGEYKKRVSFIKGDVASKKAVHEAMREASVVVHLAADTHTASSLKKQAQFIKSNVIGTSRLLEASSKYDIEHFIYISSSEVYGNQKEGIEMNEEHPLVPVSPYAVTKLAADRLVYSYYLTQQLPVVILRPFNTYGPYQYIEKMIPLFITRLMRNLPIILHHGGRQTRDWLFVDDHVSAIERALNVPLGMTKGEIFNIGTGKNTSTKEVAFLILDMLNKNKKLIRIEESSLPGTMGNVGISKKATKVLGWKHLMSIEDGIERTVKWYKKNRKWWDRFIK